MLGGMEIKTLGQWTEYEASGPFYVLTCSKLLIILFALMTLNVAKWHTEHTQIKKTQMWPCPQNTPYLPHLLCSILTCTHKQRHTDAICNEHSLATVAEGPLQVHTPSLAWKGRQITLMYVTICRWNQAFLPTLSPLYTAFVFSPHSSSAWVTTEVGRRGTEAGAWLREGWPSFWRIRLWILTA